jgi:Fic family protein
MADWDEESPALHRNLISVLRGIRDASRRRESLTSNSVRHWHTEMMRGLALPGARRAGAFRGEPGLEDVHVRVGRRLGVVPSDVAAALDRFDETLHRVMAVLDDRIRPGAQADDEVDAVIDVMAWAHAEWVRIHPFANGNGRTARLLANSLAMRYGLPPFVRLRPRPDDGYGATAARAMEGHWESTATCFRRLLARFLDEVGDA